MTSRVDGTLLNELQISSRRLMPVALSALSDITSEVSGRPLEPRAFSRLSKFFLMHFCDQFAYEEFLRDDSSAPTANSEFRIPIWTSAGKSSSDGRQHAIVSVLMNRCKSPSLLTDRDATSVHVSARRRLLSTIGKKSAPVVVAEPYLKCSRAQEIAGALRLRRTARWTITPELSAPSHEIDLSRRLAIVMRDPTETDRQTLVKRAIALTAPIELVEGFHDLSDRCARQLQVHKGLIYTANAYQSSSSFRFWVEHCRAHGARLATHQHGGGYGIDQTHLGEEFDMSVSDMFYSWGWGSGEDGVRALPPAWPNRYSGQPSSEYLLMCLPITSHMYRLQPFLMPSQVSEVMGHTLALITGLSGSTRLRVRMHQGDKLPLSEVGTDGATVLLDDLQESGTVAASRATLVLHNYLSTSWLETLAMNVPTVCFYDPELYSPREAARPYIDALARVGVIHHSGAQAARFVNQLKGNPSVWWNSAEVQEAREAFVARYANFSDNWLQAWTEEFERLLDE